MVKKKTDSIIRSLSSDFYFCFVNLKYNHHDVMVLVISILVNDPIVLRGCLICVHISVTKVGQEAYLGPCQTSMTELFSKTNNGYKLHRRCFTGS